MSNSCLVLHFELSPGYCYFTGVDELYAPTPHAVFAAVLSQFELDVDPEDVHEEDSFSGLAIRESQEHGALWFPKPDILHAVHPHGAGLIVIYKPTMDGEPYTAFRHTEFPSLVLMGDYGVHSLPDRLTENVLALGSGIAHAPTAEEALALATEKLKNIFDDMPEIESGVETD